MFEMLYHLCHLKWWSYCINLSVSPTVSETHTLAYIQDTVGSHLLACCLALAPYNNLFILQLLQPIFIPFQAQNTSLQKSFLNLCLLYLFCTPFSVLVKLMEYNRYSLNMLWVNKWIKLSLSSRLCSYFQLIPRYPKLNVLKASENDFNASLPSCCYTHIYTHIYYTV